MTAGAIQSTQATGKNNVPTVNPISTNGSPTFQFIGRHNNAGIPTKNNAVPSPTC